MRMRDNNLNFTAKLEACMRYNRSLLCIGLDPILDRIPDHFLKEQYPIFAFNKSIIDYTADLVCAYKPQIAHYNAVGAENELLMTIKYIHKNYAHIPIILDSKRGDIATTASMYAIEAFERYQADAVTVNPYMGDETITPFTNYKQKGVIILCATSNPGGQLIQSRLCPDQPLYEIIAELAITRWNQNHNILLVIGATHPDIISTIRKIAPTLHVLVPGIGAQGGNLQAVIEAGLNKQGLGLIINASRSILYPNQGNSTIDQSRMEAIKLKEAINQIREQQENTL